MEKDLIAALVAMSKEVIDLQAFMFANKDRIAEGIRRFEDAERQVGEDFAKTYTSIRAMMEREGFALPADADEFLDWYVYVKNGFVTPAEFVKNWKGLMLSDFREFAEYKEHLFYHGGKMGEIPAQEGQEPEHYVRFRGKEQEIEFFRLAKRFGIIGANGGYIKQRGKELKLAALWRIVKDAGLVDHNDLYDYDGPAVMEMAALLHTKTGKNTGNKFSEGEIQNAVSEMKKRE